MSSPRVSAAPCGVGTLLCSQGKSALNRGNFFSGLLNLRKEQPYRFQPSLPSAARKHVGKT